MFLNELNKKEATAFISLVESLANIDKVFAQNEQDLINEYIEELSLSREDIIKQDPDSAIKELSHSSNRAKKIIYFELVGLALSDGSYDEEEIEFLNNLASQFSITKDRQQDFVNYFMLVKEAYDNTFVDYESKLQSLQKSALELL